MVELQQDRDAARALAASTKELAERANADGVVALEALRAAKADAQRLGEVTIQVSYLFKYFRSKLSVKQQPMQRDRALERIAQLTRALDDAHANVRDQQAALERAKVDAVATRLLAMAGADAPTTMSNHHPSTPTTEGQQGRRTV